MKQIQQLLVISALLLSGCSHVDDYLLGKDNTPKPEALKPIKEKVYLTQKWSVPVGQSQRANQYSKLKPVVVDQLVYTADATGLIEAVNQSSGQLQWSQKLDANLVSGPVVKQGYVVVTTDAAKVIALKQSTGAIAWQTVATSEVLSAPVITANKVIAKTIDGNLIAFNLKTGEKLWAAEHGSPSLILKASSSPVIVGSTLALVGYSDGRLDAVDLETGRIVWQRSVAFATGASDVERLIDIGADPIVEGNTAYLASYQGYVGAFALDNGQFIWQKPVSLYQNMVLKGNTLYMTDSDDVVWSINKNTGAVNWKQVALKARGLTEPAVMGDRIVVADRTGMMHVLSAKNGDFISRTALNSSVTSAPSVVGDAIFVMTANGKLNRYSIG